MSHYFGGGFFKPWIFLILLNSYFFYSLRPTGKQDDCQLPSCLYGIITFCWIRQFTSYDLRKIKNQKNQYVALFTWENDYILPQTPALKYCSNLDWRWVNHILYSWQKINVQNFYKCLARKYLKKKTIPVVQFKWLKTPWQMSDVKNWTLNTTLMTR